MPKQSNIITEQAQLSADPAAPASGYSLLYPKTDGKWYQRTAGGILKITPDWILVPKTSDQSKANDTTLANDSALFFSAAASTKYHIRLKVFFSAPATPGIKFALVGPASPTLVQIERAHRVPATTALVVAGEVAYTASTAIAGNATSHGFIEMDIILQNGANTANFAFQWAQNVASNPNPTLVRAGSYLEYAII